MNVRSKIRRLKAKIARLSAEVARSRAKYRRIEAETVPVADYDEMSDLAGLLTDLYIAAKRAQRKGRTNQARDAAPHRAFAQDIFDQKRAAGHSKARSYEFTSRTLKKLNEKNPGVRVYTPRYLRKILSDPD